MTINDYADGGLVEKFEKRVNSQRREAIDARLDTVIEGILAGNTLSRESSAKLDRMFESFISKFEANEGEQKKMWAEIKNLDKRLKELEMNYEVNSRVKKLIPKQDADGVPADAESWLGRKALIGWGIVICGLLSTLGMYIASRMIGN